MTVYLLPKQYNPDFINTKEKPNNQVEVDINQPYIPDHAWFLQRNAVDLIGNYNGDIIGPTAGWTAKGFNCGSRQNVIRIQSDGPLDLWGGIKGVTIIACVNIINDSNRRFIFQDAWTTNATRIRIEITGGDTLNLSMRGAASDAQLAVNSTETFVGRHCFIGVFDTVAGSVRGFVDGKEVLFGSGTITTPFDNDSVMNTFIGSQGNQNQKFNGEIEFLASIPRAVSISEAISLSKKPYQILKPKSQPLYFTPSIAPTGFKVYFIPTQEIQTMKKNVAGQVTGVQLINSSDGTPFTGSATVLITVDGGTQSASGGIGPTHEGNGYHTYLPTQAESNGDQIGFTYTGTGAINSTVQVYTTFPQSADNDTKISKIPLSDGSVTWNSTALASINTECDTAISDYDGPTNAEMELRTITSANYATSTALSTVDTNVDSILVDTGATIPAQITALNDFDPAIDPVANVTLVGTTTVNTDMRGTDGANTIEPDNAGITANGVAITALNNISVAQIFAGGDMDGFTLEECQKLILAGTAGKTSGMETTTALIRAADDSKVRITATVDSNGNRSLVTTDVTG